MPITLLLISLLASGGDRVEGALRTRDGKVLTWGSDLRKWTMTPLSSRVLRQGPFGEGGCLTDLDRDGVDEFISVRGSGLGRLLWMPIGRGAEEQIDEHVEMGDCIGAELFGRRGVLMIHRGAQVRFYERSAAGRWTSRDIYSIYTPSYQRGLALADVDGDGRTDIFCGNYWIRSPERFEESWRLFAIHTWFEGPDSAAVRISVLSPQRIVAAQTRERPARFSIFEAPADPRQPWKESPVKHGLGRIHALLVSAGRLVAAGDNGVTVDGERILDGPVSGIVDVGGALFAIGPEGARTIPQRPARR